MLPFSPQAKLSRKDCGGVSVKAGLPMKARIVVAGEPVAGDAL